MEYLFKEGKMQEQERDFKKIIAVLRKVSKGEFTPKQLGSVWAQYSQRYYKPSLKIGKTTTEVSTISVGVSNKYQDLFTPLT